MYGLRFNSYALCLHVRSGKQELLKRLSVIFNTLKQRDKKDHYSNDDDTCKEAAREIFQILQELTESKVRIFPLVFSIDELIQPIYKTCTNIF